ncbi:MAG: hypothetical protein KAH44_15435, partial [Oricola sp.]|nr:hypothetical protein [Oricola sp.]
MRRFSESHNYAHERVPEAEHVSAVSLIFVLVGLMLTLPVFVLAGEVLLGLGLVRGAIAFAISGMLLTVLATFTGLIGVNSRLTTYAILVSAFGEAGSK